MFFWLQNAPIKSISIHFYVGGQNSVGYTLARSGIVEMLMNSLSIIGGPKAVFTRMAIDHNPSSHVAILLPRHANVFAMS